MVCVVIPLVFCFPSDYIFFIVNFNFRCVMSISARFLIISFLFISYSVELFSSEDTPAESSLVISRVQENVYVCQMKEDLFFVLEKLDQQTAEIQSSRRKADQVTNDFWYWQDFNRAQKDLVESQKYRDQLGPDVGSDYHDGITSFAFMLKSFQEAGKKPWGDQCELWIAYVSYVPIFGQAYKQNLSYANIEISFGVFNDKDLTFGVHMGISRSLSAKDAGKIPHSRISVDLHSLPAYIMGKEYMITVPLKGMRNIFQAALPSSSIFIGDNEHEDRVRMAMSGDKKILLERQSLGDMDEESRTEYGNQLLEIWAPLLETCPSRISHEYAVQPSGFNKAITFLLTGKDGNVVSIPMRSTVPGVYESRYDWFFNNRPLSPRIELPYVVVDSKALADVQNWSMGPTLY